MSQTPANESLDTQIDKLTALFDGCTLQTDGTLPMIVNKSQLTRSKSPEHGDFASNIA